MNVYERRRRHLKSLKSEMYRQRTRCREALSRARNSAREIRYLQNAYDEQYVELIAVLTSLEGSIREGSAESILIGQHGKGAGQVLRGASSERARMRQLNIQRVDVWLAEFGRAVDDIDQSAIRTAVASLSTELRSILI